MRPVERGHWPVDETGNPIQFRRYQQARPELLRRLGAYCAYCEMPILNAPTVEHVQPKSRVPELERAWCNLLLACDYCQGCKGHTLVVLEDYFWPDRDNTLRAFVYESMTVSVAPDLDSAASERAVRTIRLTGLDKILGAEREPSDEDQRWINRSEAWGKATDAKRRLAEREHEGLRQQIVETANSTGFFSVWMTVFADDADMRRRFIESFPGTSVACFDTEFHPIPRPCGAL
jgi:uncharacterized protein (TIGR02646 family)